MAPSVLTNGEYTNSGLVKDTQATSAGKIQYVRDTGKMNYYAYGASGSASIEKNQDGTYTINGNNVDYSDFFSNS